MRDWDKVYAEDVEDLPWYSESLDEDMGRALASRGIRKGLFLDIGTGPGTQAAALAARGFTVVGTDISRRAVSKARRRFPAVKFLVDDIPRTRLRGRFDYVLDRGCLHSLEPGLRESYAKQVSGLLRPGGLLFLKTFSRVEMGCIGPYRFSPAMIRRYFSRDFVIESITETEFSGTLENKPKALFAVLRRKPS